MLRIGKTWLKFHKESGWNSPDFLETMISRSLIPRLKLRYAFPDCAFHCWALNTLGEGQTERKKIRWANRGSSSFSPLSFALTPVWSWHRCTAREQTVGPRASFFWQLWNEYEGWRSRIERCWKARFQSLRSIDFSPMISFIWGSEETCSVYESLRFPIWL